MATQLFFREASATFFGVVRRHLTTGRGAAATSGIVNTTASGTNIQWTKTAGGAAMSWVSGRAPAAGATISGAITINLRGLESATSANAGMRLHVYKMSTTGALTEVSGSPTSKGTELGTTQAAQNWSWTPTSAIVLAANERLVVDVYLTNVGTMGGSQTATFFYDGPTAAASGDSYITLTETIAFKQDTGPVYIINGSRGRNDDGSETTASWKAAQNTNWNQAPGETFRFRQRIQEISGISDTARTLTAYVYQNFVANNLITTTSNIARFVSSANVTDEGATTQQLTGGLNTFTAGTMNEDNTFSTSIQLNGGNYTEIEGVFQLDDATTDVGDQIWIAFELSGTTRDGEFDTFTMPVVIAPPTFANPTGVNATGSLGSPTVSTVSTFLRKSGAAKPALIKLDSQMRAALGLLVAVPFHEMNGGIVVDYVSGLPLKLSAAAGWGATQTVSGGKTAADNSAILQVARLPNALSWPLSLFWRGEFLAAPTGDAMLCGIHYDAITSTYPFTVMAVQRNSSSGKVTRARNDGVDYLDWDAAADFTVDGMQSYAMVQKPGTEGLQGYRNGVVDGTAHLTNVNAAPAMSANSFFGVGDNFGITGRTNNAIHEIALLGFGAWTPEQIDWLHNNAELIFDSPEYRYAPAISELIVTLAGISGNTSVGVLAHQISALVLLSGISGTLSLGSPTVLTAVLAALNGIQATGNVGTPSFQISATKILNSVAATGSVGSVAVLSGIIQQLIGLQAAGNVGQLQMPFSAIAQLLGISTEGLVGTLIQTIHDVNWHKEVIAPTLWRKENEQQTGRTEWS